MNNSNKLCLFIILFSLLISGFSGDDCSTYVSTKTGISLEEINGKCIAVTKGSFLGSASSSCKSIGQNFTLVFTPLSIDSQAENEHVKDGLATKDVAVAYIGLNQLPSGWSWMNGDPSGYRNWAHAPVTQPPTAGPTTTPFRSTLPPSGQRRSTAVVVGVDASLFTTNALTFSQIDFIRSLSHYIADRGPAEFAFFAYGCTQTSPYISQYPSFVSTFDDTDKMILKLNETINLNCVRSSPLDFRSMFRDQTVYYNRYSTSYRPFRSKFLSMIYFSSSTDSANIKAASALYPMANSSIITVNVGDSSIDISSLSIPVGKYGLRVKTSDDIMNLVPNIDSMIFGATAVSGAVAGVKMDEEEQDKEWDFRIGRSEPLIDATTYTDCAYMNTTDGLWYSDGSCSNKLQVLCQYELPQVPTPNPTYSWQDPCYKESTNFTYFDILSNAKCYRVSTLKKQFAEAENTCLSDHPLFLHTPKLTSIETRKEEEQIKTLVSTIPNEGMFWFGLKRDPSNSSNWLFINGDSYDATYQNWREGYPRDADGCDCVALVMNDNTWVNTDCNKQLYSICAYRFNTTDKAY